MKYNKILIGLSIVTLILFSGCNEPSEVDKRLEISRAIGNHMDSVYQSCRDACDNSQMSFIYINGSQHTSRDKMYCKEGCWISQRESTEKEIADNNAYMR